MIKSNKAILFLFSFFMTVNFCTPVFAAFFQLEHGFSETQITSLFAVYSFTVFLFEIPTGLIGDRIGEKKSLIIGALLTCFSSILFIVGNVSLIYIGEIIFGVGSTFYSGPFESLVYKYCEHSKNNLDYENILSKTYSLQWIALCFSFVGCSIFTQHMNIKVPFLATLCANIVLCIIAIFLPVSRKESDQNNGIFSIMKGFVCDIGSNKQLRTVCLLDLLCSMILVSAYQLLQTYLLESSVPKSYNGLLYFIATLLAGCGSFFFEKLQAMLKSSKVVLVMCLLVISACFFGLSYVSGILPVFILVCGYRLIWGITSPMFVSIVNRNIVNDIYRNTAFSVISLGYNLGSSVLLFTFVVMDMRVKYNYIVLSILSIVLLMVCVFSKSLKVSHDVG